MEFKKIVERKLVLSDVVIGEEKEISIEIGRPSWREIEVEAICPVFIRGLMKSPLDIYGSDLLNALECALKFIDSELKNLSPSKKVLWPGGEPYFDQSIK